MVSSPRLSRNSALFLALSFSFLLWLSYTAYTTSSSPTSTLRTLYSSTSSPSSTPNTSQPLSYRAHLERTTSPPSHLVHSRTWNFGHVYVLSLANRKDRRDHMRKLARALDVEITFVDAAPMKEGFVRWIAERVKEKRDEKVPLMAKTRGVKATSFGGLDSDSDWLARSQDTSGRVPFPSAYDPRFAPSASWTDHLEMHHSAGTLSQLQPSSSSVNVSSLLRDEAEKVEGRQISEAAIATYFSHLRVIKMMIENGDKEALIMEDDVDIEFGFERMWNRIRVALGDGEEGGRKNDWDVVYAGHCWSKEMKGKIHRHPLLHVSDTPLCLHGYVLSLPGAQRIFSYLSDPWVAYQTPIDCALPNLILKNLVVSYSVQPPLVIQGKELSSDLRSAEDDTWRGVVTDSTQDRVRREEEGVREWRGLGWEGEEEEGGREWPMEEWVKPNLKDPAVRFRERHICAVMHY